MPTDTTASAAALAELLDLVRELNSRFLGEEFGNTRPDDVIDGRVYVLHALQAALGSQLDVHPDRPVFRRLTGPNMKVLGDNPDAVYFGAYVQAGRSYRIHGNLAGATFTSFSQELGTADGGYSRQTVNVVKDSDLHPDPDGNFEFVLSAERRPGNWFPLHPQAGLINTRHFFERERPAASDPTLHVPLAIECLDPGPAPPPRLDDAALAARIRCTMNYVRGMTLDVPPFPHGPYPQPGWVSTLANHFNPPADPAASTGWANMDAIYALAPYELQADEALVIEGRLPACRFANVLLYTRFLQTYDYINRCVSLNRQQIRLRADGSFRVVVAHRDPCVPNWLDTAGRTQGRVFWRFLLPEEPLQALQTRVMHVAQVRQLGD
ncbi:MAG TPA: DUF1214 domain-containing protein [Pseudomonadales bacterium]|nr:DUF1214 domain-containing protein [Pseudomonadales bacterium]HND14047.1 DUF1214 domain-containing protein [Pseudomonadales bacterium]